MSADLTTANKKTVGAVFPAQVSDSPNFKVEPLLTPEQLVTRHLFGIPLVSGVKDPRTGKHAVFTDDILKDIIRGAVDQAEAETHLDITPVQRFEKHDWSRLDYQAMGYFRTRHRPVAALQEISVVPPNGDHLFEVPLEWCETGLLALGIINIIPLLVAVTSNGGVIRSTTAGAAIFLSIFSDRNWLPSFWQLTYTSGFPDGMVPRIVNDLIGVIAAVEVLSMLAATHAQVTSQSLGIDGLSQSTSGPGYMRYQLRMQELAEKRKRLINKLKAAWGLKLFAGDL